MGLNFFSKNELAVKGNSHVSYFFNTRDGWFSPFTYICLIGQLEQEVVTAQMRVQNLETECPSDWSPMKNELDDLFGTIGSSVDRAWRDLSPGEVGG